MLCERFQIKLHASHLPGKENIRADALSRLDRGEWSLSQAWANHLFSLFGRPYIDIFATAENAKIPTFCCRKFHPRAWKTDAFSFPWEGLHMYAFPPWSQVQHVLSPLRGVDATILLVAPCWPMQPWFPLLLELLVDLPLRLPDPETILTQKGGQLWYHDRKSLLHLSAWKISGSASSQREFHQKLPAWQHLPDGHPRLDPLEASVEQVSTFLMSLFSEGKQISTIKNYRSAIAAVHRGFRDGSNDTIHHLLRGMFHKRPPMKTLPPSWSLTDVLKVLAEAPFEPMHAASLENVTHKTLFLIAAASTRRRSGLHALTIKEGFLRFEQGGVRLLPDPEFLAKNRTELFTPQEIFLPALGTVSTISEDKRWCPVRALRWYMERTRILRQNERLFILPRSPYTPASKDTLSRWIRDLIRPHVSPSERPRAHDVRGHSTSRAWFTGVPLEDIMKAAAWKTPTSFISCYLTDTLSREGAFARAALRPPQRDGSGPSTMGC